MTKLDEWTLSLLQNKQLLKLLNGRFTARQVLRDKEKAVWAAVSPEGERYIALFNLSEDNRTVSVDPEECADMFPEGRFSPALEGAKEVWTGESVTEATFALPPHGAALVHIP